MTNELEQKILAHERLGIVAIHEAGHAVIWTVLERDMHFTLSSVGVLQAQDGDWHGKCSANTPDQPCEGDACLRHYKADFRQTHAGRSAVEQFKRRQPTATWDKPQDYGKDDHDKQSLLLGIASRDPSIKNRISNLRLQLEDETEKMVSQQWRAILEAASYLIDNSEKMLPADEVRNVFRPFLR